MQRGLCALICARDEIASRRLSKQLTEMGVQSDWVRTAQDAISRLATKRYDSFAVDLILPDQDGISLIRWLRSYGCETPIVGLSLRNSIRPASTKLHAAVKRARTDEAADRARAIFAVKLAMQRMDDYRPRILALSLDDYNDQLVYGTLGQQSQLVSVRNTEEATALIKNSAFDIALADPEILEDQESLESFVAANSSLPLILNTPSSSRNNTGTGNDSSQLTLLANIIRTYAMFGFQIDAQAQA